jgi:zinc protease
VIRPAFFQVFAIGIIPAVLSARPVAAQQPPTPASAPAAIAVPVTPVPVREALPGGLRLIVEERPGSALTALEIRVRAGSGAETAENNGVAHALEHMVFRGSDARAPGAIDREIERLGGDLSARTTRDDTKYAAILPSARWRDGLGLIAELLQTPTFPAEQWEREKTVIRAEMAVALTDPTRSGFARVASAVYAPSDPYQLPLLGTSEAVNRLTSEDLRTFWKAWYRPENITVVIVGDVKPTDAKRIVTALFPVPAENAPPTARSSVTVFSPLGQVVRAPDLPPASQPERSLATVQFAFRAPAATEGDTIPTLDTLMSALCVSGRYGRLSERLRDKDRVALTVATDFLPGRTGSLILFTVTTYPGEVARLQKAVEDEIRRLREDPLTNAEVEAARADAVGRFRYESETVGGRANRLAFLDLYAPQWTEKVYLDKLDKVTDADLRTAILRYLTPASYAFSVIGPSASGAAEQVGTEGVLGGDSVTWLRERGLPSLSQRPGTHSLWVPGRCDRDGNNGLTHLALDPPYLSQYEDGWGTEPTCAPADPPNTQHPTPYTPSAPKPVTFLLNNGARLVVLPEPDADTIAIHAFFRVGLADEGGARGINALIARAWGGESENRSAALLRADVARVGGIGTDFADDWTSIWGLSSPEDFQKSCQTLLTNLVGNPRFASEGVAKAKEDQRQTLALDHDRLTVELMDRLRARLFGASPYSQPPQGSELSIAGITPETMTAYYHRMFRPSRCVVAIAGKVKPEEARRMVEAAFGAGGWNERPDAPPPVKITPERVPSGLRDQIVPRRAPGTVFAFGVLAPGTEAGRSEYASLLLLNAVLSGGKSARLYASLRDGSNAPVGYDIQTVLTPNRAQSLWAAYIIGEAPARVCRDALVAELAGLADGSRPVTAEELERAKVYLKARHAVARQRRKDRAFGIGWAETMGLGADFDTSYDARLDAVTLDEVNGLARRVFGGGSAVVYTLPPAPPAPPAEKTENNSP